MSSWPCYILFSFESYFIEVFGRVANAGTAKLDILKVEISDTSLPLVKKCLLVGDGNESLHMS